MPTTPEAPTPAVTESGSLQALVLVIGTGGTIAGVAARQRDGQASAGHLGYEAGVLGPADLIAAVPALAVEPGLVLHTQALAQLDSCHMDHATWQRLLHAVQVALDQPDVSGVVITHGTDTLEETAYFLHQCLRPCKPVVLTAAMRPATAPSADGPQNLLDAVRLAALSKPTLTPSASSPSSGRSNGSCGVRVVLGGTVFAADALRKVHGYRLEAFAAGDAGPLARWEDTHLRTLRPWPTDGFVAPDDAAAERAAAALGCPAEHWPVVDIVTSHAGARADTVRALVASGSQGLVVAGTGNGSIHRELAEALLEAQTQGVRVLRATRCTAGGVTGASIDMEFPHAADATPAQARVALMLTLLVERMKAHRVPRSAKAGKSLAGPSTS